MFRSPALPVITTTIGFSLLLGGCFDPEDSQLADTDSATAPASSDSAGDTDGDTGMMSATTEDSADGDSSGAPTGCGNGVLEDTEECDLGSDNADNAGCTSDCRLAVCGDGLLYIDQEDCDDGGESATCDVDCTPAECGDGVLNVTAAEQCDAGGESADCNADCSASACGDGILNVSAGEECDGNDPANAACDACTVSCMGGFEDCNVDPLDGCEVPLCGGTCEAPGSPSGMAVFDYTGAPQQFIVPPCVAMVSIDALGASGGNSSVAGSTGGLGGQATGDLMVATGQVLHLFVGQEGVDSSGGDGGVPGSYNGGGSGGTSIGGAGQPGGAAGGGASDVRVGGMGLADRVLVAAGGGGAGGGTSGGSTHGGAGGGLVGGPGVSYASGLGHEAQGGSQVAGGAAGSYVYGIMATPGGLGDGGDGAGEGYSGGGGGGGGYYGGGGGSCHFESGGGGGSSYTDGVDNGATNPGVNDGHGQIVITW